MDGDRAIPDSDGRLGEIDYFYHFPSDYCYFPKPWPPIYLYSKMAQKQFDLMMMMAANGSSPSQEEKALFTAPRPRAASEQSTGQMSGVKSTTSVTPQAVPAVVAAVGGETPSKGKRKWTTSNFAYNPPKKMKMIQQQPEGKGEVALPPALPSPPPGAVGSGDGRPCSPEFYDRGFGVQVNKTWLQKAAAQVEEQMHLVEEMETTTPSSSSSSESEESETTSESEGWMTQADQVVNLYGRLQKFLKQLEGYYIPPEDYMNKPVGETTYARQVIHSFRLMTTIKACFKPIQNCMTQCQKLYPEQVEPPPAVEKKKAATKKQKGKQVTFETTTKKVILPIKGKEGGIPPMWKKVTLKDPTTSAVGDGNPGKSVNKKCTSVETVIPEPEGTTSDCLPQVTDDNTMESQTVSAEDTNSEDKLYQRDTKGSLYVLSDEEDCESADEESEDKDPDQAVRDLAVQMDLPPVDEIDKQQRANKAAAITSKMEADKLPHQQAIPDLAVHLGLPPVDNKDKPVKKKVVVQTKKTVKGRKKSKEPGVKV